MSIGVDIWFYYNGLKSKNLGVRTKTLCFFPKNPFWYHIYSWNFLLPIRVLQTRSMWFSLWKRHLPHGHFKCVRIIPRLNLKIMNLIIKVFFVLFWVVEPTPIRIFLARPNALIRNVISQPLLKWFLNENFYFLLLMLLSPHVERFQSPNMLIFYPV